jgi:hypothetical protein
MDRKMRDRKDTLINKHLVFRLKLANIAPKTVKHKVQEKKATMKLKFSELLKTFLRFHKNYNRDK